MKSRVARKVLKQARRGRIYRLSTLRSARRWRRRQPFPYRHSPLAAACAPFVCFQVAMDKLFRALAVRLGVPAAALNGDMNYLSPGVTEPRALIRSAGF